MENAQTLFCFLLMLAIIVWVVYKWAHKCRSGDILLPSCRNCSETESEESACRSSLSCIVKYAERKSRHVVNDAGKLHEAWMVCPRCKQEYQGQLASDLAETFLAYAKRVHPLNGVVLVVAVSECCKILGRQHLAKQTKVGIKNAIAFYEYWLKVSASIGHVESTLQALSHITNAKFLKESDNDLKQSLALYELRINTLGAEAPSTIEAGLILCSHLRVARCTIEAKTLTTELATMCKRALGSHHGLTRKSCSMRYEEERRVRIYLRGKVLPEIFHVLQYNEDSEMYVVRGPISRPRKVQEEKISTVATKDAILCVGTPVFCRGFKKCLSHLNGKIGEVRSYSHETDYCFVVRFEDKKLGQNTIKQGNLQILF